MTNATHTPGPWQTATDKAVDHYVHIGHYSNTLRTYVCRVFAETEEQKANARLIAAAPELLEVAKEIATGYCTAETMFKAQAAIAKAEGK